MNLTLVICTHNRARLLARTLASLNAAARPRNLDVNILVVANACTDGTANLLKSYCDRPESNRRLPLRWVTEPKPGKSHALNRAIGLVETGILAFVDDDHRVDEHYLFAVAEASRAYPVGS